MVSGRYPRFRLRDKVNVTGLARFIIALFAVAVLPAQGRPAATGEVAQNAKSINVIFDTDIWSDIDDMLALAMLHALQDRGEVKLLAVTISTNNPWSASYVDLVDTFYGHPDIPIGIVQGGMTIEAFKKNFPSVNWPITRYTEIISRRRRSDGAPLYPHRLIDGRKAADAVLLLRKTLAAQPDASVVVILVGYSTNIARLLETGSDALSPLTGRELVRKKVRLLSVMGGKFRETLSEGKTVPAGEPEFNLRVDVPAAQTVFSSWPTPVVASGFEVGVAMLYPGRSILHDYSYVEHHPIADSYRTYCEEVTPSGPKPTHCPADHDHPTFDLTAVLYAARPNNNYFSLSEPGTIKVLNDGGSRFEESVRGMHRYLLLSEAQKARALEAMVMLASQPPAVAAKAVHREGACRRCSP